MGHRITCIFASALLFCVGLLQAQIPPRPHPPRLVNDLAGIFSEQQCAAMERELARLANTTSNQIAVLTVNDLGGYDIAAFGTEVGHRWGVGQKEFDNGVVITVLPKKENRPGEINIAVGYGLEAALTDAICKRIIELEVIPYFKEGDYYGGICKAIEVAGGIASGEITTDKYTVHDNTAAAFGVVLSLLLLFILIIIVVIIQVGKNGPTNLGGGRRKGPGILELLLIGSLLHSSRSSGRSSGGFGGFGGSLGGFGGFGGGGFGGGGASGKW